MTRQATNQEQDVLNYLNELRDSGETNMFGATPYIQNEFYVDRKEAVRLLKLWMANFNEKGNYKMINE